MKTALSLFAVAVVALSVSTAKAENVSRETLSKMGLSTIKVMSDAEGMQVRGKFVAAYSGGTVSFHTYGASGTQSSGAAAVSNHAHHADAQNTNLAIGGSASYSHGHFSVNVAGAYSAGSASANLH